MNLYEKIIDAYPELADKDFSRVGIHLQNDSDDAGDFIREWSYSKPIPNGLKLGK